MAQVLLLLMFYLTAIVSPIEERSALVRSSLKIYYVLENILNSHYVCAFLHKITHPTRVVYSVHTHVIHTRHHTQRHESALLSTIYPLLSATHVGQATEYRKLTRAPHHISII